MAVSSQSKGFAMAKLLLAPLAPLALGAPEFISVGRGKLCRAAPEATVPCNGTKEGRCPGSFDLFQGFSVSWPDCERACSILAGSCTGYGWLYNGCEIWSLPVRPGYSSVFAEDCVHRRAGPGADGRLYLSLYADTPGLWDLDRAGEAVRAAVTAAVRGIVKDAVVRAFPSAVEDVLVRVQGEVLPSLVAVVVPKEAGRGPLAIHAALQDERGGLVRELSAGLQAVGWLAFGDNSTMRRIHGAFFPQLPWNASGEAFNPGGLVPGMAGYTEALGAFLRAATGPTTTASMVGRISAAGSRGGAVAALLAAAMCLAR